MNDSTDSFEFFVNAPRGLTKPLVKELRLLGAEDVVAGRHGIVFKGALKTAYRVCLWSRLANRVMFPLIEFEAEDQDDVYKVIYRFPWEEQLDIDGSLAVSVSGKGAGLDHSRYAAQKIKDAVVDRFKAMRGRRPSVNTDTPDIRIHCHLNRNKVSVSIDLSGDSLHRRGYRAGGGAAPLKENLAAAILHLAGWRNVAKAGGALLDPMCGSGTLLLEGAMMAGDIAPGLKRGYWGFEGWLGHDVEAWESLLEEAEQRKAEGIKNLPPISGFDVNLDSIRSANENIEYAGLLGKVHVERRDMSECVAPKGDQRGLVVVNPPYGLRVGEEPEMLALYADLGRIMRERCSGWKAAVFTARSDLIHHLGLTEQTEHHLYNGAIETQLYNLRVSDDSGVAAPGRSEGGQAMANRLAKNRKRLSRWLRRERIECYRVYDADIPEYAFAVDVYGDHAHVQEYTAPKDKEEGLVATRRGDALAVISDVLSLPRGHLHFKMRQRQRGSDQYKKQQEKGEEMEVREGGLTFFVNLDDYLDTGLFLDHRITRSMIRERARGKRFLNLYAYTGAFTVYAAHGGAETTTTVDMSKTYLDWSERNMQRNGFQGAAHRYDQSDCMQWLKNDKEEYDLIFIDPPTFSNSKRMEGTFDVQRDHVELLTLARARLSAGGVIVFSNNQRGFKLDEEALNGWKFKDISRSTIPEDFARRPNIHRCWEMSLISDK